MLYATTLVFNPVVVALAAVIAVLATVVTIVIRRKVLTDRHKAMQSRDAVKALGLTRFADLLEAVAEGDGVALIRAGEQLVETCLDSKKLVAEFTDVAYKVITSQLSDPAQRAATVAKLNGLITPAPVAG